MPLTPGVTFPTGAEKALEMSSYISTAWPRLGRPCSERVIDVALRFAKAFRKPQRPTFKLPRNRFGDLVCALLRLIASAF